jgi:hypothetical protein
VAMPEELPREFDGPLNYDELIDMLTRVEGEPVFMHMGWGRTSKRASYIVGLVGTLRNVPVDTDDDPRFGDEAHFAIGSGEALPCGGTVILARSRVQQAHLHTMDGNDYFVFGIDTDAGHVTIAAEACGP